MLRLARLLCVYSAGMFLLAARTLGPAPRRGRLFAISGAVSLAGIGLLAGFGTGVLTLPAALYLGIGAIFALARATNGVATSNGPWWMPQVGLAGSRAGGISGSGSSSAAGAGQPGISSGTIGRSEGITFTYPRSLEGAPGPARGREEP